jgi:hypothetical protein
MSTPDQLQTIDLAALAQVSGGIAAPAATTNDQILTALTGILDSIHSLAGQSSNGGGFNQQEMFMLMMLMQRNNQPQQVAVSPPWTADPIIRYY